MTNEEMKKVIIEVEEGINKIFDKYNMTDKEFTFLYSKIVIGMSNQIISWNFEEVEDEREGK